MVTPKKRDSVYHLGNIFYGYNLAKNYQKNIEYKYFEYHLKNKGKPLDFSAKVFDMGTKKWHTFDQSPFDTKEDTVLYLGKKGTLTSKPKNTQHQYISDPYHQYPL